jgi:hypothetical protein
MNLWLNPFIVLIVKSSQRNMRTQEHGHNTWLKKKMIKIVSSPFGLVKK